MIKLVDISKVYQIGEDTYTALDKINLEIKKGEFSSISGPSGSGKSTLMHIIGLLDRPTNGKVLISGQDTSEKNDDQLSSLRNRFIGFVFQQFNLINKLTVMENIMLPTLYARGELNFDPKDQAQKAMNRLGILEIQNKYPNRISGGQQQRVAIARALIMNPEVILADEPTGNLDTKNGLKILEILKDLNKDSGVTVLIITHDMDIAKKTNRNVHIVDGQIVNKS